MALMYLLLLLPALALARIQVGVTGTYEEPASDMNVNYSGDQIDIISDKERDSFGLSDSKVKDGVKNYFGERPDDAYLRSPTPWGDLYQSNGWSQVARTLTPRSGKILSINSKPLIVMRQVFENNSTKEATFNVAITTAVDNTVSSSWSKSGELTVSQEINYGFDIELVNMGGSTTFSYTSGWGQNTEKIQSVTIGTTSALEILLKPGESVVAELHATKAVVEVEVEYEASLDGAVAVNYSDRYKDHYFWALGINPVMSSAGLQQTIVSKEVIEIDFYAQSKVVVRDGKNGNQLIKLAL
ncbi:U-megalopygitoxin(8)-Mo12-like [Choristoneura fumiferana]|uniref:U-megalopygitoxin(8)-Mo12-like n=1 Tax=Choristoneura fumiferana TaxID=7141 RepID=UPI003D1547AD